MTDFLDRISNLSPKRLALLALEQHEQLQAAREREHEPLAVVGLACRFPGGADDPDAFWALLREGRDAIREVPAERWDIDAWFDPDPDAPGRMSVRHGGFLDVVSGFDNGFFGISPREATTMDPQQRLLLETAWHALEHAGLGPERLAGSATGVFVGICNSDHFQRVLDQGIDQVDAYLASGNAHSVASGRIAYCLGLQGPALSIDTACSSSLVALHAACRSLRSGESRVALAAGVNLMCAPETTVALTKAHMLAPDGRCKTFDAGADGFARGEGCGVLVLKRLSDARADGDRVLALVRGSAINQDGRSSGLTVPNGPAQEAVIRAALADAGVAAADIGYVEAHGTGTSLGDPIEVRALAGALGAGRSAAAPLWVGSVKTNIGHLESAAGIAGVIKVVLALQHQQIPPHLHFTRPSPHIAWDAYPVRVAPQGRAWPRGAQPRLAGVSSFGFSGTNAHVVIEEAPADLERGGAAADPAHAAAAAGPHCLPLSARSPAALAQLAGQLADALQAGAAPAPAAAARTLGAGRSHFAERAAVVAADAASAAAALRAAAAGVPHPALRRGSVAAGQVPEVVFLFTGQGAQYPGMARALYEREPVFRDVIDHCDARLGADAQGRTLKQVLWSGEGDAAPVHETAWTQPALFAVEYGLAQLWRAWGVEPAAVIGHSVGEYVAACVAGVFGLDDGLALIAERGRLMQALPPGGTMAALFAPAEQVAAAVAPHADRLAVAAVNAPDSVVVSGDAQAVDALLAGFAARDVQGHRLYISLAAHSPLVAPALEAMQAAAARVPMQPPRIPVAWNVTGGQPLPGGAPDAAYWRRHLREPVRFADGMASLHAQGFRHFLEVGPHPTLIALAQRSLPEDGTAWFGSLRRGRDDRAELMGTLAALYVHGAAIDWPAVHRADAARPVPLPGYPFEHRTFWLPATPARGRAKPRAARTLRCERLPTAVPIVEAFLTPAAPAWLGEHRVHGEVLVAAPVLLALAQDGARQAFGGAARRVSDFGITEPLVLPEAGRCVQVQFTEDAAGALSFSVHSRAADDGGAWRRHAGGRLDAASAAAAPAADLAALQARLGEPQSCAPYYERLAALGVQMGPALRCLREARRVDGEALARLELAEALRTEALAWVHPVLLDGALQAVGLAVPAIAQDEVFLFTGVESIDLAAPLPPRLWCHVRLRDAQDPAPAQWLADVQLLGDDGAALGRVAGVCLRRASRQALQRAVHGTDAPADAPGPYYALQWERAPAAAAAAASLAAPRRFGRDVGARLGALAQAQGLAVYDDLLPQLDRLAAEHAVAALQHLRFDDRPGRVLDGDAEARALGVLAPHARLFDRLLQILAEDGWLRRLPGEGAARYEVARAFGAVAPQARYDALLQRFGAVDGELRTLRRCGAELGRVLDGTQDPIALLFPGGSLAEARQLYVESPYARTYNAALAEALQRAIAALPAGARLRILEIGAGTGGTTTYVLPGLDAGRVEYVFTDLSPLFLDRAAEQFAAYPFVRRALLDIERDPAAQGFAAGGFDVVIAANVLHATADLAQAVRHARSLLAPGGQLYLLEGVAPERWVDLTFGLTDGWWRFTDAALRPAYPLIGRDAWVALLGRCGFDDVLALPDEATGTRAAAQQALLVARAVRQPRRLTLVGAAGGLGGVLAERLSARGDAVALLPALPDALVDPPAGDWVYLGALDAEAASCEARAAQAPLALLNALCAAEASARAWLVTRGVHAVDGAPAADARWQAPLWGLGRGLALEQPARWGGLVDLDPAADLAAQAQQVLDTLDAADAEDQTAWRGGHRHVARLGPLPAPPAARAPLRADATYLVTGGFGGLGLLVARWLAEQGARHIALLGRRPDASLPGVRAIEAAGARVIALAADVADEAALARALQALGEQAPPLRGVLHAAAAFSGAPLGRLSAAQMHDMLAPKLAGTLALERLTRTLPLDFTVLFSSTTALLGASGLAHYAAANAFLDATAQALDRPARRVLSIDWGTWEAMRLASADAQRGYREGGLEPLAAAEALDAIGRLLAQPRAQTVVARIDWSVLKPLHEARRVRPLLAHLDAAPRRAAAAAAPEAAGPTLAAQLAPLGPGQRQDALIGFVQQQVAGVLGQDAADAVPLDAGLFEMGMDSLMSVELRRRLERGAGRPLPSTLTFNYPNVRALAGFIARELGLDAAAAPAAPPPAPSAAPLPGPADEPDDLDALSDDELEARLLARLEQT